MSEEGGPTVLGLLGGAVREVVVRRIDTANVDAATAALEAAAEIAMRNKHYKTAAEIRQYAASIRPKG